MICFVDVIKMVDVMDIIYPGGRRRWLLKSFPFDFQIGKAEVSDYEVGRYCL